MALAEAVRVEMALAVGEGVSLPRMAVLDTVEVALAV
jgi:hypothetical protein